MKNYSILLIDDEEIVLTTVGDDLREAGYNVTLAPGGKEGIDKFKENYHDLVITDLKMEGMGGIEVLREIKNIKEETMVMILTGYGTLPSAIQTMQLDAFDYLLKPCSPEELYARVRNCLDQLGLKRKVIKQTEELKVFNENLQKEITKRTKLAEELKRTNEGLEVRVTERTLELSKALERLKELNALKNQFLGIASHDLRSPIFVVRSYSEALMEGHFGPVNEKQRNYLGKILNSSEFMINLINNLLDISKIESGQIKLNIEKQDLVPVIKTQIELGHLNAKKKDIKLLTKIEDLPTLFFDKNALTQVLNNLIGNAIKYSPQGTEVIINSEILDDYLRISVDDEGPGISPEEQNLLFGEFQTLSAQPTAGEKATGLGLAIVKKMIGLHGGEVGIFSEVGKGSKFFFTLPLNYSEDK